MKSIVFGLGYTALVFFSGIVFSQFFLKQPSPSEEVLVNKKEALSHNNNDQLNVELKASPNKSHIERTLDVITPDKLPQQLERTLARSKELSNEKAQFLLQELPQFQVNQYLDTLIGTEDIQLIDDKRQFASRAIEEYFSSNDSSRLEGSITISDTSSLPDASFSTDAVKKNQSLFAHLDTNGLTVDSGKVFIKWINADTKKTLLFEQKSVEVGSSKAWVRLKPKNGWQTGNYEVKFYQFHSALSPIAQTSYRIFDVL